MPKWSVVAERTQYYSLEVEAATAEEAFEIAKNSDIDEWSEDNVEWYQNEAEKLTD
jgi:hypothetical protein